MEIKWKHFDSSDFNSVELMIIYDSNFWFSLAYRLSHGSGYDSNSSSIASENQHLKKAEKPGDSGVLTFLIPSSRGHT